MSEQKARALELKKKTKVENKFIRKCFVNQQKPLVSA